MAEATDLQKFEREDPEKLQMLSLTNLNFKL